MEPKLTQENLDKMYSLIQLIANDYVELSHEKILWQRNDYMKRAKQIVKSLEWIDE